MPTKPEAPPIGGDDDGDYLVRVLLHLPKSTVSQLDRLTGPGRSRSAVARDLLADCIGVSA